MYRSSSTGALLGSKDEIIQGLNIIMGHIPKAAVGVSSIGSSKHFPLTTPEKMGLGAGLTALRGFFFSVRATSARVIVNAQVKSAAFYDEGPLELPMRAYLNENGPNKAKLGNFLKRLSVNVTHIKKKNKKGQSTPRIKKIAGLATPDDGHGDANPPTVREFGAGAKDVLFYLAGPNEGNGDKAESSTKKGKRPAKAGPEPPVSGGKYISVYDFFQQSRSSEFGKRILAY
jgi:eukaryotic translation initiation factor 2C